MSNILALATRLRALDDSRLAAAIADRSLSSSGIKDFFDLAEAFLDRQSIQRALTQLDRHTLALLATVAERPDARATVDEIAAAVASGNASDSEPSMAKTLVRLARPNDLLLVELTDDTVSAYDCVVEQLHSWPVFGLPSLVELISSEHPHEGGRVPDAELGAIDRLASERAFAATTIVTELLLELEREPARELAKGGIALPDKKRLANAMAVDLETVSANLAIAHRAGLVTRESGAWLTTEPGTAWLLLSTHERWSALAVGWLESLPDDIRQLLRERSHFVWGDTLRTFLTWLYPAGREWVGERISVFTHDAELLGVTANEAPSSAGALLLAGNPRRAEAAMRPLLPAEVANVYLQHDLSVVAPGPLTPATDARLRVIADVENRALAATYRVSASSINRALASGESAASILQFLADISLTGIPQPLHYLIDESSKRYGLLRVGEVTEDDGSGGQGSGARSYLRSDDANLLGTLVVDQNLSGLGLTSVDGHRLVSRFAPDLVFWSLSDLRYPVAAEDSNGNVIVLERRRVAKAPYPAFTDPIAELIERLRIGGEPEPGENDQAWLARQLDSAIHAKLALTVSIRMPDGSTSDYQLEPTSVAGGRLRARDRRSDIERTLPLSSIAGIGPGH